MIYDCGQLNKKIDIYTIKNIDESGFDSNQKVILYKNIWAKIAPARGKEYYESYALRNDETVLITIRYRKDIDESCTIVYKQHIYNIQSIVNPFFENESLELYCVEKKRGKPTTNKANNNNNGGWQE